MVSSLALSGMAQRELASDLNEVDAQRIADVLAFVEPVYTGRTVVTGQDACAFSVGVATTLASLQTDADTRIAALLFELPVLDPLLAGQIETRFGKEVAVFVEDVRQMMRLHELTFGQQEVGRGKNAAQQAAAQLETLRKMLLAMASDMRVVLVRLASRTTTLRYFAEQRIDTEQTYRYARETLDLYAPLANRLGVWQLKWEMEDLSFRFLEPTAYKQIARMLEEKRIGRETFVASAILRLQSELASAGIEADVFGRPKHIYSIWNKMRGKSIDFSSLHDVRAFRVIVEDVKTCYAVLGIVHDNWVPVPEEFDDYIARPKPNGYQSLHTIVMAEDGRPLEVQIRTKEMHYFAEYGVAAHWRYKESGGSHFAAQKYDEKIAWLRQLLAWKSDVADSVVAQDDTMRREWVDKLKSATLDDRIYVLTPQARVIELPSGATPIDFAYHLHSDVGHRCRGARVDGAMVPLNTALRNGQTVEIITARGASVALGAAGPSRDWLSPGYAVSARTRAKVRAWFNAIAQEETLSSGRGLIEKTLQREGKTAVNLEELAHKLGFLKPDDLYLAVGKDQFSLRHVEQVLHADEAGRTVQKNATPDHVVVPKRESASSVVKGAKTGVLVVGTDGLLTQLAKCCKPAPPDAIVGFVTRGKGISIHRADCKNFVEMQVQTPERVIQTSWGSAAAETVYPVDIFVMAGDRQGLLRDISEVFLREKINVVGVSTQSAKGHARMAFTAEIASTAQLMKALSVIREVDGVMEVRRA
ncbi:bifunctional (p)ppGpp synthetase/guanosine-3',5'-bis(diphosphate) 3'-pyrophosphohydrolase [Actimicrobium sp. CCI2.3]|uniref:RelA/SpoT family protein n=1 Tax=Actimicrobium sp. CCI2.3 TaxID=3048616 RepID=UPI002AB3BD31|nr:bifunctional (p)ppGpp synthetase/guanosine-3',5'-bis(diphosphate) 3'-pyrophosphohydrolase [Actimicrobium sp. CCI2.3]MDY7574309.1 bifunctional (p)ppGpp synthetase/guanosine-3',5'-bis(diphosphate) 3'-pyrophosphohydrolase [Actimicrobium sp. CCI2.3]MEB0023836.1 bifunctional (p)ppGpp synthetase/guanosine-3',5'-bis(diphosphate) 3'-pyrophosphohydrolase [Actimicrobium sp. CCI2.3]